MVDQADTAELCKDKCIFCRSVASPLTGEAKLTVVSQVRGRKTTLDASILHGDSDVIQYMACNSAIVKVHASCRIVGNNVGWFHARCKHGFMHQPPVDIRILPIIDLNPNDKSCILSSLSFVADQAAKLNIVTPVITFDQQLFIKAVEVIDCHKLNSL